MEPSNIETKEEVMVNNTTQSEQNNPVNKGQNSQKPIISAIIFAGLLIAGAILIRGGNPIQGGVAMNGGTPVTTASVAPVGANENDRVLGDAKAKVTMVTYEDFQCPYCGKFFQDSETNIRDTYVKNGSLRLVFRDFAFLGAFAKPYIKANDESINAAIAARCAEDQGKFWEYHDYLFTHQNGEDQGNFSVAHLKSFAKDLALDTTTFNQCLDAKKYAQAVDDSKAEASNAGVNGTPFSFLISSKNISPSDQAAIIKIVTSPGQQLPVSFYTQKNIVSLNGALPWSMVKGIIDILVK